MLTNNYSRRCHRLQILPALGSRVDNISMLPISDYAWTEQQFMQMVSIFAYVYSKDVSAPLESICYLGPHAWYIKENFIKQARKKGRKKKNN